MHVIEDDRGNGDIVIDASACAHKFSPNVICGGIDDLIDDRKYVELMRWLALILLKKYVRTVHSGNGQREMSTVIWIMTDHKLLAEYTTVWLMRFAG